MKTIVLEFPGKNDDSPIADAMMHPPYHILIIEDNLSDFHLAAKMLSKGPIAYTVKGVVTLKEGIQTLSIETFNLLFLDLNLPDSKGLETLHRINEKVPEIPIIVLTSKDDEETAVAALQSGAQDYLIKGSIHPVLLNRSVRYAMERKQVANVLKQQYEFLSSILESFTHPFIVVDAQTSQICIANSAHRENRFHKPSVYFDMEGGYRAPSATDQVVCPVRRVRMGKAPVTVYHSFTKENHGEVSMEIEAFPILDQRNQVDRVILSVHDISASETAKRELNRLSTVIKQSPDSVMIMETDGTIVYVNPAFERITGYAYPDIVGKPHTLLLSDRNPIPLVREIHDALKSGNVWQGEVVTRKRNGLLFEEEMRISPVRDEIGEIINFVAISRDITGQKRLESIAEAANLMTNIGYIFSGIRHEIGNPINSIKMALTVLNNNMATYSREMIKEFTERCLGEIIRVEYLLRALKNFSMFETPDVSCVRLDLFIKDFIALVNDDFMKKGITIHMDLPHGPVFGYADPRAMHQVFLNLFTNAADALTDVAAPRITVVLRKEARLVCIEVSDNGIGMSEAEIINLFQPFYTSKANGTGLGLVIVKKMLAKMNSTIKIRSQKGCGTRVLIFIPEDDFDNIGAPKKSFDHR